MKKILVTGGVGFVGSNLIRLLLEKGHNIVSLDNYDSGTKDNHHNGVTYIDGDIETIDTLDRDFDIIYHCAALSRIQPSFNNPDETYRVNTLGTQKVCEFARKNQIKIVYAGSSSKHHNPYQSPYAACKYMGEEVCKMYKKTYSMNIEIARFYNVYGPAEIVDGDWAAVIGIWRRQVRDKQPITIVGDGEQRRDFTHVNDICDALWRIGMKEEVHNDAWELGTGTNYSINEVYQMFRNHFNNTSYIRLPDQNGNYRKTLRENNDALERLGWEPQDKLLSYINSL
jgi:UDP-glucose 4-epimerase